MTPFGISAAASAAVTCRSFLWSALVDDHLRYSGNTSGDGWACDRMTGGSEREKKNESENENERTRKRERDGGDEKSER